jgi:hypothetical protein
MKVIQIELYELLRILNSLKKLITSSKHIFIDVVK